MKLRVRCTEQVLEVLGYQYIVEVGFHVAAVGLVDLSCYFFVANIDLGRTCADNGALWDVSTVFRLVCDVDVLAVFFMQTVDIVWDLSAEPVVFVYEVCPF